MKQAGPLLARPCYGEVHEYSIRSPSHSITFFFLYYQMIVLKVLFSDH
jgi:hypothetical protein